MPDDVFWDSTPAETMVLIEALTDQEYARRLDAWQRAALVAATICNVHRRKGARPYKVEDFVKDRRRRERDPEETWALLKSQLLAHNARLAREQHVREGVRR